MEIKQLGSKVLRQVALTVAHREIANNRLSKLIESMTVTLEACSDGVGLAAPQVGESIRLFIVSPRVFTDNKQDEHLVYINPKITKKSREKAEMEEGCLSVKNNFGLVNRSTKVTVEALDENGNKFVRGGSGLLAEIFQHEIDHLDGKLFVDTAKKVREILPHEQANEK